uniref:Uncharacterized protein n=1 Tax=Tetranychus urticae TaxID=32264 RepID=T1L107_TETUR
MADSNSDPNVIKQSVHYQGLDFPCKILEKVKKDNTEYGLVQVNPYYERMDYLCTAGEEIPTAKTMKKKYKCVDQLIANSKKKDSNVKYQCPYCLEIISARKDTCDRHIDGRLDYASICKERIKVEPDRTNKGIKRPIMVVYEIEK